jgi:hypothetical protein
MRYHYDMSVTLAQFRSSLGAQARGVSDAELQKKLDYMYRLADAFYGWWDERKGGGVEAITLAYASDTQADSVRDIERIKATRKSVHLLPQADVELVKKSKQYENRFPYNKQ